MHELKTAKLFEFCLVAPFIIAGKNKKTIELSRQYGKTIGKIFQIIDDICDFEEDDHNNILKYYNKSHALDLCRKYQNQANSSFQNILSKRNNKLTDIIEFIINQAN